MKVSIITSCFNSEKTIEDTIQSVLSQTYPNIEYIIIDGKSTDKTLEIVNNHRDKSTKVVSEKDNGIYDAMNKGIKLSTGDYILFLNAGDRLSDSICIEALMKSIDSKNALVYYTDVVWVDLNKKVIRAGLPDINYSSDLYFKNFPHSGTIYRKSCFVDYGYFRDDLKILADYEMNLRLLIKHRVSYTILDTLLSFFYTGGISTSESGKHLREKEMNEIKSDYFKNPPEQKSSNSKNLFNKLKSKKDEKLNRI